MSKKYGVSQPENSQQQLITPRIKVPSCSSRVLRDLTPVPLSSPVFSPPPTAFQPHKLN